MIHSNITEKIIKSAFEVHSEMGSGFLEKIYERCMQLELARAGLPFKCQKPIDVYYKEQTVGEYIADLIVVDKVLIELKAVRNLTDNHIAQIIHYLKATRIKVGLLLNFGAKSLQIRRFVR